jgi:hypothetical protein
LYFQGFSLILFGVITGVAGLLYLYYRVRRYMVHEVMLGTAMTAIGWCVAVLGGVMVLLTH